MAISLFCNVCSAAGLRSIEVKYKGVAVASYLVHASNTDVHIKANIRDVTVGLGLNLSVSLAVHSNEIFPHL